MQRLLGIGILIIMQLFLWGGFSLRADTTFYYTLSGSQSSCITSAAVYRSDGTLVRTLWRKQIRYTGANTDTWDNLDDSGNPVGIDNYTIRLIGHNVQYTWEGAVGNTSLATSGSTVHRAVLPIADIALAGTKGFYCTSFNEGHYDFHSFSTNAPQQVLNSWTWVVNTLGAVDYVMKWRAHYARRWKYTTTDGAWVYFGCPEGWSESQQANNQPGYIMAMNVIDDTQAYFTNGTRLSNAPLPMYPYPNGITAGTQSGLSGLAVQQSGNILAAAVRPDNCIYLYDKRSGLQLSSISITSPKRMVFAPNNNLWVVCGTSVICYANVATVPTIQCTILGLSNPLAVAVSPTQDLVVVADGGASMQLKGYSTSGALLWTYGQLGGNPVNGPAVLDNRFWFTNAEFGDGISSYWMSMAEDTFVTFAADGSFWVGDGDNARVIHFSSNLAVLEKIASGRISYNVSVDPVHPTRVFSNFLEYQVDYTKPLGGNNGSWTLINNWRANVPSQYWAGSNCRKGLLNVTTLENERTYAQIYNGTSNAWEVCELASTGLRATGTLLANGGTLNSDGSLRRSLVSMTNGSFEDTTEFISPWNAYYASQLSSVMAGPAADGNNYLDMQATAVATGSRTSAGIWQNIGNIDIQNGYAFVLSFDAKSGNNPFTGIAPSIIALNGQGGVIATAAGTITASGTVNGWTHYEGRYVFQGNLPGLDHLQLRYILYKDNSVAGTTYEGMLDHIVLTQSLNVTELSSERNNGSFETSSTSISPWVAYYTSQLTSIATSGASDGNNYLDLQVVGVVGGARVLSGIYQNISGIYLENGQKFSLSYDMKNGANPCSGMSVSMLSLNAQGGVVSSAMGSVTASGTVNGWTHYQGSFVLQGDQSNFHHIQIRFIFYKDGGTAGAVYESMLDNIVLTQPSTVSIVDRGHPRWLNRSLVNFDTLGNPQWSVESMIATATGGVTDPLPNVCSASPSQTPITTSNIVISYDQSLNDGWHLGGIRIGDNKWLWKACPASTHEDFVNPIGNYDIGDRVRNAGNIATSSGRHIIAGYHGEWYRNFQASQFMHFYDNGLFIGQFGVPDSDLGGNPLPVEQQIAGFAGNAMSPVMVQANGNAYMYVNDEWGYGPQRWRLDGLNEIVELSGAGMLNSTMRLEP